LHGQNLQGAQAALQKATRGPSGSAQRGATKGRFNPWHGVGMPQIHRASGHQAQVLQAGEPLLIAAQGSGDFSLDRQQKL
jgi:hypothetical protein